MNAVPRLSYHFAVLRVVPRVHLGAFVNVGVVLHARTASFLGMRSIGDLASIRPLLGDLDLDLLARYLRCYHGICEGDPAAGPIALLPASERFHWITAPRSDALQTSPVHEGLCDDPAAALDDLFAKLVR